MGGFGNKLAVGGEAAERDDPGTCVAVDAPVLDPGSNPEVIDLAGSASRGGGLLHEDAQTTA